MFYGIKTGRQVVGTPGTADLVIITLTDPQQTKVKQLTLQADPSNDGVIAIGGSTVVASETKGLSTGLVLTPDRDITILDCDITAIYFDGTNTTDSLIWFVQE